MFHRSITASKAVAVGLGTLFVLSASTSAHANPIIMGVTAVPGQENQTVQLTEASTTLYQDNGWICTADKGSDGASVSLICRHNNGAPATAVAVDCNNENMRAANMIVLDTVTKLATLAVVCGN